MRRHFFEVLALLLLGGSLVFFVQVIDHLARRDYVASIVLMVIGLAVLAVGRDMARLALVQKE
jgi:hypothetical protein